MTRKPPKPWMRGRRRQSAPWGSWHLVNPKGRSVCGKFDATTQYRLERSTHDPARPCKNCIVASFYELERSRILNSIRMANARS